MITIIQIFFSDRKKKRNYFLAKFETCSRSLKTLMVLNYIIMRSELEREVQIKCFETLRGQMVRQI